MTREAPVLEGHRAPSLSCWPHVQTAALFGSDEPEASVSLGSLLLACLVLAVCLVSLVIGCCCLFFPSRVHDFAIRWTESDIPGFGSYNPFRTFIRSDGYRLNLLIIQLTITIHIE